MGSQQPRDANGIPFGYDLNVHQTFLFSDPPPEPAPGPPLLSDIELRETNDWFQNLDAGNFNTFLDSGEGLNFTDDWLLLPPQYVGSTTSFGQQPNTLPNASPQGFAQSSFHHNSATPSSSTMPPPPIIPHQQQRFLEQEYSADVLAAATTLSQNGSMSQFSNGNNGAYFGHGNMGTHMPNLPHRPMNGQQSNNHQISHPQIPDDHNLFVNMLHGHSPRPPSNPHKRPEEVKWGSDVSFGRDNFTPRSEKETSEALEKERLTYMECLEVNKSAANTRPSSPVQTALKSPLKLKTREPIITVKEDPDGPARKRRKSKATTDYASDDSATNKTNSGIRRKRNTPVGMDSASPPASQSNGKRRKSSGKGAAAKSARENLSEEQKRENHIKSEQKRRTLIKQGFIDMEALVPGMKGGGFSKATMLTMATEWLENMMKGNEELREQLRSMGLEQ
ncbi:BHLH family transcription factor [Coniochaeta sp. 2T2.1]|nr:BHLH family transcription factor [Coniochaeta sp. 2T2.1]